MAEYIEREAALLEIEEWADTFCECDYVWPHVIKSIRKLPAADVRPVVRGHIEEDENTYLYCSECNCNITLAAYETPNGNLILRPNYCPNCGADMRNAND